MNKRIYDASLVVGILLSTSGAAVQWGVGPALMVAGGLVIGLSVVGVWLGKG